MTALVIAAHGTRIEEGQQQCRALIDRVRRMLPDVRVLDCYVELDEPTIADAVTDALETDADKSAVVVPLMIGTGSHVEEDIPEGFGAGIETVAGSRVTYAPHLGPDPRMISAVCQRISAAAGDWSDDEISVVFLGRGTSLTTPNADHARLGRVLLEKGGYADLTNAYIQVTHPNLTEGLQQAYDKGGRKIVVMPHFLFHGRLENWTHKQANEWVAAHPDARFALPTSSAIVMSWPRLSSIGSATHPASSPTTAPHRSTWPAGSCRTQSGSGRWRPRRRPPHREAD